MIAAQKARFTVRELLNAAYAQEPTERAGLFKIIGEIADESSLDDLVARIEGKDPVARLHIIKCWRASTRPKVQQAVQRQLKDNNKLIRSAALSALARMDGPFDMPLICGMLRDPEIEVQNKAVDVVVKANHPDTIKYLVEVLKDENEYARRAAVEVLNVVGNSKSVKYLLEVIADSDWWVRTPRGRRARQDRRPAGGRRRAQRCIKDENQDIRRAAIEILNQTKDERAVAQLIEATQDSDWWVSERAVDALAEIGSTKALPRFIEMLQRRRAANRCPTVVRAIGKLGDQKSIEHLLPLLQRPENEIKSRPSRRSRSWPTSAAPRPSACGCRRVGSPATAPSRQAVARAMTELDNRFSDAADRRQSTRRADAGARPRRCCIDNQELADGHPKETEAAQAANAKLDIAHA